MEKKKVFKFQTQYFDNSGVLDPPSILNNVYDKREWKFNMEIIVIELVDSLKKYFRKKRKKTKRSLHLHPETTQKLVPLPLT